MKFGNGKSYEEALSLSETHQIPFQKNNIDFFMITIDGVADNEVNIYQIRMNNRCVKLRIEFFIRLSMLKFVS
jgi:hypothetical protein